MKPRTTAQKAVALTLALSLVLPSSAFAAPKQNRVVPEAEKRNIDLFDPLRRLRELNLFGTAPGTPASGDATNGAASANGGGSRVDPEKSSGISILTPAQLGRGNGGGASGAGAGAGAGSGSGPSGGSGDDRTVVNENGGQKPGGNQPPPNNNGGGAGSQTGLTVHPLWWPICAYVDPSVSQATANAAIKGMIDMGHRCGVNVVVYPVTVDGFVDDPDWINGKQRQSCNIIQAGVAKAASTTALVPFPLTAAKMCEKKLPPPRENEYDPAVAGCAEVQAGGGGTAGASDPSQQASMKASGHSGGSAQSGQAATSIEVPIGHKDDVLAHEAMGHSQMGLPNYEGSPRHRNAGNGIGIPADMTKPPGSGEMTYGWTPEGCGVMVANALPNTDNFAYDANRQLYYVKEEDPSRYYNFAAAQPLFGPPQPPPPPGPSRIPPIVQSPPSGTPGGGNSAGGNSGGLAKPPALTNAGVGEGSAGSAQVNEGPEAKQLAVGPAAGHKNKPGGKTMTLGELRRNQPPGGDTTPDFGKVQFKKFLPPGSGGVGKDARLVIDETAPENLAAGGGSSSSPQTGGAKSNASAPGETNYLNATASGGITVVNGGGGARAFIDEGGAAGAPTAGGQRGPASLYLPGSGGRVGGSGGAGFAGGGNFVGTKGQAKSPWGDSDEFFGRVGKEDTRAQAQKRKPGKGLRGKEKDDDSVVRGERAARGAY